MKHKYYYSHFQIKIYKRQQPETRTFWKFQSSDLFHTDEHIVTKWMGRIWSCVLPEDKVVMNQFFTDFFFRNFMLLRYYYEQMALSYLTSYTIALIRFLVNKTTGFPYYIVKHKIPENGSYIITNVFCKLYFVKFIISRLL